MTTDTIDVQNRRHTLARLHIDDDTQFVNEIILERDKAAYPDPYFASLNDADLLRTYLKRVNTAINSYNPTSEDERQTIEEFHSREVHRIVTQVRKLEISHPTEYGISHELVQTLDEQNLKTGYGMLDRNIPWDAYHTLYSDVSLEDLRILAEYFTVMAEPPTVSEYRRKDKTVRVINAIRFVRDDPTVSLEDIIVFKPVEDLNKKIILEETGEKLTLVRGVPFETVKDDLEEVVTEFDTFPVAIALANISEINNAHNQKMQNGSYGNGEINFSERIEEKTGETERNIVAHEFFHSLQDVTATRNLTADDTAVDFDADPNEWERIVLPDTTRYASPQESSMQTWFTHRAGNISALCDYQAKNYDEFYAVGFEALFMNPSVLKNQQSEVYEYLTNLLSADLC